MNNHKSNYELAKEAKSNIKTKAGQLKGMFKISYRNPKTTIYCRTEEKRKIHEQYLKERGIPYVLG